MIKFLEGAVFGVNKKKIHPETIYQNVAKEQLHGELIIALKDKLTLGIDLGYIPNYDQMKNLLNHLNPKHDFFDPNYDPRKDYRIVEKYKIPKEYIIF